jgi:hypothetical protein
VEAQHIVSTMRLVDTLDEQAVLEQLLEKSKPALPPGAEGKHYLLFTPFRYRSPFGSRFRRPHQAGVWYGAEEIETVCAEIAYWRWRFLTDSEGLLGDDLVTQHTLFNALVSGSSINLMAAPWLKLRRAWRDPADYARTQELGEAAREAGIGWIRYESARRRGGTCCAVLDVSCVDQLDRASEHTWQCKVTRGSVLMVSDRARFSWTF